MTFALPLALLINLPTTSAVGLTVCADTWKTPSCTVVQAPGVPGPAPLLGLGVGFHWSRKLRRRINQTAAL